MQVAGLQGFQHQLLGRSHLHMWCSFVSLPISHEHQQYCSVALLSMLWAVLPCKQDWPSLSCLQPISAVADSALLVQVQHRYNCQPC